MKPVPSVPVLSGTIASPIAYPLPPASTLTSAIPDLDTSSICNVPRLPAPSAVNVILSFAE